MFHLAELNVARVRAPLDDPTMADFVDNLERVNALAEASPGFVWRLQTEAGNATDIHAFADPAILLNLSVWASLDDLRAYVYRSDHTDFLKRRREWFVPIEGPATVLWWVSAGTLPSVEDALARRERVLLDGATPHAFTFRTTFPPPLEQIA
jgi:hypothetical protein